MMPYSKYIDHTLLKPDATKQEITKLCQEAQTYQFASVCVNPYWVSYCHELLKETNVHVCTVIGFPLGATSHLVKGFETKVAIENGADEIDMVINIGALKERCLDVVKRDIQTVMMSAQGRIVKVIIETCLLNDEEIILACQLAKELKVDFVKTSTGFSTGGATVHDVKLMKETVGDVCCVKASGGIRTLEDMKAMIEVGASRIGTSFGVALVQSEKV